MSMKYFRDRYGVPAKRGGIVRCTYTGRIGRITSAGMHLRVLLDGDKHPSYYHPTTVDYKDGDSWLLGENFLKC